MSIIFDFPAIKSKLRGDDRWEPAVVACEPVASVSDEAPAQCVHAFSDYDFRCKWCGESEAPSASIFDGSEQIRRLYWRHRNDDNAAAAEKTKDEAFYAGAQWTPEQLAALVKLSPLPVVTKQAIAAKILNPD